MQLTTALFIFVESVRHKTWKQIAKDQFLACKAMTYHIETVWLTLEYDSRCYYQLRAIFIRKW